MKSTDNSYIFASSRTWGVEAFLASREALPGDWTVSVSEKDLFAAAERVRPRFIFFPHWSQILPEAFLDTHECVCFHMTDLPYGRGGSPLQNLIAAGRRETMVSALRMVKEVDAGPIYLKRPMSLHGSAQEVFRRVSELAMEMILDIVRREPLPLPQDGAPTFFKRRRPEQSKLPPGRTLADMYDHIRMLDAPGYPHACLTHGSWTVEFTDAMLDGELLEARAVFRRKD
jgi:methionyl-tRNA formyltransferase